ncbi:MAG: MmgE/PrpD family protein [Mesorhizobium sp.]|uniref:MmgE/PrpD family protein n=1 Tax=unclassified Mesorhizobium TaxID=325217 RepID=UPI000F75635D|nr:MULTISPECIES: MmgE/PrpD family protein [unclassified Mesorhizobium]AZO50299.1 MmgE/PrpD family protein [Mesorhizobium sp. M4B.F.Ca.ET.058.02.1.1]RWD32111.1 MAG: MmgE/PrpD family protein [Mesorhizobium sp.]TIW11048.1 MAG: MmgE/PrpD family protein [Mesorhizobium sp.]TIW36673.1 MAG: MmgE/PrpD family protein [Mesorhizobium sp.]
MDVTTQLIRHVLNSNLETIPEKAIERAKLSILDTIACAIGGSNDPIARFSRDLGALSGGKPECTVWVSGEKLPASLAALVNATTARALDFDETYEICINGCHASAYDVPPALALAERDLSITGSELLCAVATAIDLHMRLARSVTTNAIDTGRDNMVAVWGATAVSTKLLRLDEEKTRNAFGIAYAHAAGEFQMYEEGAHTVALQQGLRARSGLEAALSAMVGFNGPREPFFGKYGFYKAFEPDYELEMLMDGLGSDYLNASISFKPWPSCRATHHGIHGLLQLRERHNFTGEDIVSIELGLNQRARSVVAQPHDRKWNPKDPVVARFSLPYAVSVAAQRGSVAITDFRKETLMDPAVREIMAATKVEIDPEIDRTHGRDGNSPTTVKVNLKSGAQYSIRIDEPFGHPENPALLADGMRKLEACAEMSMLPFSEKQLGLISEFVNELDKRASLAPLFKLLVGGN